MEKTFTVECKIEERWIPHFMSMLKEMERLGDRGSTRVVGIVSDGDGDFRPKFNVDFEFDKKSPTHRVGSHIYDAG